MIRFCYSNVRVDVKGGNQKSQFLINKDKAEVNADTQRL